MDPRVKGNKIIRGNHSYNVDGLIPKAPRERQPSETEDLISETSRDRQPLSDHDEENN